MRGPRFGRTAPKKSSAKKKEPEPVPFIERREEIDIARFTANTLNAIDHLGDQRFPLPPFEEHFKRWLVDVESLLTEFETNIPDAADQEYRAQVARTLVSVQKALEDRIAAERAASAQAAEIDKQIATNQMQLSKLDNDYRKKTREVKEHYSKFLEKLNDEIRSLDKQRLQILRKRPSLLQRIMQRPDVGLQTKTAALKYKRGKLGEGERGLRDELNNLRLEHERKRVRLVREHEELRARLAELIRNNLDDALEVRRSACQDLRRAITDAVNRLPEKEAPAETTPNPAGLSGDFIGGD